MGAQTNKQTNKRTNKQTRLQAHEQSMAIRKLPCRAVPCRAGTDRARACGEVLRSCRPRRTARRETDLSAHADRRHHRRGAPLRRKRNVPQGGATSAAGLGAALAAHANAIYSESRPDVADCDAIYSESRPDVADCDAIYSESRGRRGRLAS
jgi:hypothetical protein